MPFEDLSDGEKCFMICAVALAANEAYGPLLCFWDEPDNYLALDEVGHFVMALRQGFQSGGQFIATSHNPEAISSFSEENTLVLHRRSHQEPTIVRKRSELQTNGDFVGAWTRGDVEAMSVNRYRAHLRVLPEDDANKDIATGFYLELSPDPPMQVLGSPAAGPTPWAASRRIISPTWIGIRTASWSC